jgi:hypothetical protein
MGLYFDRKQHNLIQQFSGGEDDECTPQHYNTTTQQHNNTPT